MARLQGGWLAVALGMGGIVSMASSFIYLLLKYSQMLESAEMPLVFRLHSKLAPALLRVITSLDRNAGPGSKRPRFDKLAEDKSAKLAAAPPAPGGICFIGSSLFTFWRGLQEDFASLSTPVFNAAFGGSRTHDLLPHSEALCFRYEPSVVVYFCGANNMPSGWPESSMLEGFQAFVTLLRASGSKARVLYLGWSKSPYFRLWRADLVDAYERSNEDARRWIAEQDGFEYMDTAACAWADDPAFYLADLHHLNDRGHTHLAAELRPAIDRLLAVGPVRVPA
jgi:hypothetical protein